MEDEMFKKLQNATKRRDKAENINVNYSNLENEDMDQNHKQQTILKRKALIKCLMVLAIKKYTWYNELSNNFDIFKKDIDKFRELMYDLGYMHNKLIWEIPDDVAYYTIKAQIQRDNVQIFALTPDGEEWAKQAMDYIAKQSHKNQSLHSALNYVLERTKTFKKKYQEIYDLEWENTYRYITHQQGKEKFIEERETLLGKKRKQEKNIALANQKLQSITHEKKAELLEKAEVETQQLLIENKTSENQIQLNHNQSLIILEEENKEVKPKTNGPQVTYNGIYDHVTNTELEEMSQGVTDQEYKEEMKSGHIGYADPKELQDLNETFTGLKMRGYHGDEELKEEKSSDIMSVLGIE